MHLHQLEMLAMANGMEISVHSAYKLHVGGTGTGSRHGPDGKADCMLQGFGLPSTYAKQDCCFVPVASAPTALSASTTDPSESQIMLHFLLSRIFKNVFKIISNEDPMDCLALDAFGPCLQSTQATPWQSNASGSLSL